MFSGLLALAPLLAAAGSPENPAPVVLPATVIPTHYDLDIRPDSAGKTFAGKVRIDISVSQPTRAIVLNAADLDIHRFSVTTTASPTGSRAGARGNIVLDESRQTATFRFPMPLSRGRHVLAIEYAGKIHDNAGGLFGLAYDTPGGPKRALFTQLEASGARRLLPCWDEPARKATFTVAMMLPADDMAVSNMPVVATEILPNGMKHVHFATTPRMSSYLLFLGAGDFERVARQVDGIDVGVIAKRGDAPKVRYALDVAAQVLPFYEDYFGVKFPLPKLDLVAGPGGSQFFSAMENWGAIFYFEAALESDPTLSTQADLQKVYIVVAHEIAHQWFGDLVTMRWWDELWLNEAFASWMAGKVTDHFNPGWQIPLAAMRYTDNAMIIDGRQGTHPIVRPIRDVHEADSAFDAITYYKGMAVVTMLEAAVGEDAFRAGVRQYIQKHAYGNTVSDDLWAEIDRTAAQPVSIIAHDFTLQAGVPLVRVVDEAGAIELQQERFAVDESAEQPTTWHVPVLEHSQGTPYSWSGVVTRDHPGHLEKGGGGAIVINVSHRGYFRTLYSPALLHSLLLRFGELAPEDQAGLLSDTHELALAGLQPLSDFLELARRITPNTNAAVLRLVTEQLRDLDTRLDGLDGQPRFRDYVRKLLEPIFIRTGWTAAADDSADTRLLRTSVLATLSQLEDTRVVSEGRTRFASLRADPHGLDADLRNSVLAVVAENADATTWEQLHEMARHAGSFLEKQQLYETLGAARDPELARRALQLTLGDELAVTERPELINTVARSHFPEAAFEFASTHFQQVNDWLAPDSRNEFAARLLMRSGSAVMLTRLQSYTREHLPPTGRRAADVAAAAIAYNVKIRSEELPKLEQWLQSSP